MKTPQYRAMFCLGKRNFRYLSFYYVSLIFNFAKYRVALYIPGFGKDYGP